MGDESLDLSEENLISMNEKTLKEFLFNLKKSALDQTTKSDRKWIRIYIQNEITSLTNNSNEITNWPKTYSFLP